MNAVQRSRGGGRMKAGILITSTRISQSTRSAMKNNTGSRIFFQENCTVVLRADVKGKRWYCQENRRDGTIRFPGEKPGEQENHNVKNSRKTTVPVVRASTGCDRAACRACVGSFRVPDEGSAPRRGETCRRQCNERCSYVPGRGRGAA